MYLIGFYSKTNLSKLNKFNYYKKSFKKLIDEWIKIIYFYQKDDLFILKQEVIDWIKNMWVSIIEFQKDEEIFYYLQKLSGKLYINTFEEQEIQFTNKIKKILWQATTVNPDIFLNKYLQRKIIGEKYPESIVQYKKVSIEEIEKLVDLPPFPFIIKPTWWIQSSWVCKIDNHEEYINALPKTLNAINKLKNKKLINQEILIEEFIDWKMYTVDYYVDEKQNITIAPPVYIKLWIDYKINDFCNISRFISNEIEEQVNKEELNSFIKKTVLWWEIKNTFVHHEFKINSKWIYKTIEINWRIWWYRLGMYQLGYDIDLLSFPFIKEKKSYTLKNNVAEFALYPREESIFNGYNEDIINKIQSLKSFNRINKWELITIWTKIWLTQNGYIKLWWIELVNNNYDEFKKDVEYLEMIYFDILKLK